MSVNPQYDVDAPEGALSANYFSRKDVKVILGVILGIILLFTPLYYGCQQQRDKQVCATNMHAAWQAMMLYAAEHNDRLPPIYHVGPGGAPLLNKEGKPFVWATLVQPYMNSRAHFWCPSAEPDEHMPAIGVEGKDISLTYGMYAAMNAYPHPLLAKPDDTALLVETSNFGSQGSFNPLPFKDADGNVVRLDAFMAGYDDSNEMLTPESKWVTRMAIRGVSNGYNSKDTTPRHGVGIHVFFVNGSKGFLKAPSAEIKNIYPDAEGPWHTR